MFAIGLAVGLVTGLAGTATASARTTACKKGYARNKKSRKCVKVKRPTATTVHSVTTTTAKPATGVSKGTVLLGTLGTSLSTTTNAKNLEENRQITQAWVAQTNAAGGINGYKVKILYKDVLNDSARTLQAVKDLDAAGVLAIAGEQVIMTAADSYIDKHQIPVVGGSPNNGSENDQDPMYFPTGGNYSQVYGQVAAARDVGAKHFRNLYCTEVAACAVSVGITKYAADREGLKFSSEGASAVQPDYTATCLSAKNAGVDFFQSNGLNFPNVVRDCSRQNYHPTYAKGGAADQSVIDAAKGDNVAGNLPEFGIFYNGPEVQRFRQALATTNLTDPSSPATQESVKTWVGLEMAGAVLKRLNMANPTRQEYLNALYTIKGEDLGGQIAPVDYTVQKPGTSSPQLHSGYDCWTEHLVKDGKLYHMDTHGQIVTKLTWVCGTGHTYLDIPA
ncbi:MAG: ABC transporter substrate-binding protein [Acidobacteria bacterium]|nr:ABC transporter substrate-binding protein [Acidobacteriota bacterium]